MGYFISSGESTLVSPPRVGAKYAVLEGDLFVHHATDSPAPQVWIRATTAKSARWVGLEMGSEHIVGSELICFRTTTSELWSLHRTRPQCFDQAPLAPPLHVSSPRPDEDSAAEARALDREMSACVELVDSETVEAGDGQ
jgi:hypothetical protein